MGLFSKTASDNTAEYVHCISERAESARKGHHWPRRTFTEQTGTGKEFFLCAHSTWWPPKSKPLQNHQ